MFATIDDLSARRPGGLTGDEIDRASVLLEDAEAVVRLAAGRTIPDPAPHAVKMMVCRLVLRSLDNPSGIASESVGDYSYRRTREAQAGMSLTPEEVKFLRQALGAALYASTSIYAGPRPEDVAWVVPTDEGGEAT
ncbi:Gp19/Gp15/Gp42 family protein [Kitasatospora sp. NPDC003701]